MNFPTDQKAIWKKLQSIRPKQYGRTRNFIHGAVTYLGPYLSRGVLSTLQVLQHLESLNLAWGPKEKLIQELAWREHWQQIWRVKGDSIFEDLKQPQTPVSDHGIPKALLTGKTSVEAIDKAIDDLMQTGYIHNHLRMYLAMLVGNIGQYHWSGPSQWMYYHLLDGDLASNALSWQWVVGSNASKKYYANQENINTYTGSAQRGTFLDSEYEDLAHLAVPAILAERIDISFTTELGRIKNQGEINEHATCVYNYYNLDPLWHVEDGVQRVLLIEPSHFASYPVSTKCLQFMIDLSKNIPGIKIWKGEFSALKRLVGQAPIYYKEHPANAHYEGVQEHRDWMSNVFGGDSSFFKFWNKVKKELQS